MRISKYSYLISLIAGALLVLAFAPFHQFYLAIISAMIFYKLIEQTTPKRSAWLGLCYGIGQFGVGVSWVYISIHVYGSTPAIIAVVLTGIFVIVLALFHALQAYILTQNFPNKSHIKLFLAYPSSWALIEWLRSWLFTGFPWLLLGYSQVSSPLKGYVPILGEFGITFLVVITAALLLFGIRHIHKPFYFILIIFLVILIWGIGKGLSFISWTKPIGEPITVALVQGDIPQSIKWDPKSFRHTLKVYYEATQNSWGAKIILWPEGAIPIPKRYAKGFLQQMDFEAKEHHASLFTGIPVQVPNRFSYYNAMIALGEGSGHYYKRHLVPFGEFVPFANLLRGLMGFLSLPMSDMISGPKYQPDLKAKKLILAPFICYEIAYARALLSSAPRSNVLVTISDDAWFGDSLAPFQHLEIGQFRSIQSGRDMLFASNDGITALINHRGIVYRKLPQFQRLVLKGQFQPRKGMTPWLYYGNRPIILLMLLILWLAIVLERRNNHGNT